MENNGLGNPATLVALAPTITKTADRTVDFLANNGAKVVKNSFLTVAVLVTGYYSWKYVKAWRVRQYLQAHGHEAYVIAAMVLYKAMHKNWSIPVAWFWSVDLPDGTDEAMLNQIAIQVQDIKDVAQAYHKIYGGNLHLEIQNELSTDEMITFYNNLGAKGDYEDAQNVPYNELVPFYVGEKVYAANPNGTPIFNVVENGSTYSYGPLYGRKNKGELIGTIMYIFHNDVAQRISYLIDQPWTTTEVLVNHREISKTP